MRPPPLAVAFVKIASEPAIREAILGDLQEGFLAKAREGRATARSWYWSQAIASTAPLLGRRLHGSALASAIVVAALSILAVALLRFWQERVARGAAVYVAAIAADAPIAAGRLVYVAVQMLAVLAVAAAISRMTFRREQGVMENASRRLGLLAVLIVAPPIAQSVFVPNGYSLDFMVPWAVAMVLALYAGAALGTRMLTRT